MGGWGGGWGKTSSTSNTMQRPCDQTISQTPEHSSIIIIIIIIIIIVIIIIIIIIIIMHEILKFCMDLLHLNP